MQRQRSRAERGAVRLDHGLAELLELVRQLLLGGADLLGRLVGGLGQHFLEDLLVGVGSFGQTWLPTIVSSDSVMWPVRMMWDCTS